MSEDQATPTADRQRVHYRVSIIATLVFTVMMLMIYIMGLQATIYEPTPLGTTVVETGFLPS